MGLLRRAATAVRGEPRGAKTGTVPEEPARPRGPGLLRRSMQARQNQAPPEVSQEPAPLPSPQPAPLSPQAPAAAASLTIELAGEEAVRVPVPVRVQAPLPEPEPAAAQAASWAASSAPQAGARRAEDVTEEITAAIASLRGGMELPSRMFTALSSLLGIRKGAFLLYDPLRLVFAPWAQRGYDQTTRHRLRIALGANEAWNALANGKPLLLTGAPTLAPFQPFFSSREFASVTRIVLAPFIADDKLVAVLLATEIESPLSTEEELSSCLSAAAAAGAPRVQEARAARLDAAAPGAERPEAPAPRDDMTQFLSALSGRPAALLVSLSVEEFSRQVLALHEDLDPFRLHEDLQFFVGSFLSDVGKAMAVRPGRFTLALPDFDASALDVLGHQLTLFLRGLFDGDKAAGGPELAAADSRPPIRILRTASWPADGPDLRALVESLST